MLYEVITEKDTAAAEKVLQALLVWLHDLIDTTAPLHEVRASFEALANEWQQKLERAACWMRS